MNTACRWVSVNDADLVVGQDHHRARLSDHYVWLIQELREGGLSYNTIAEKFEISKATVADICKGRRRAHLVVGRKVVSANPRRRIRPAHPDEFDVVA